MKRASFCIVMLSGLALLLAPALAFPGTVMLPRTGQTVCYDANGAVIACSGTGQDGELQKGAAWPDPRFSDQGDQTILDNLTGLVWTKDGNVMKTRDPGFDNDGAAGDGRITWYHALDYIKKLNQENYMGHNDWRLPNVVELESLINTAVPNSAVWLNSPDQGFSNVEPNNYWTSSTFTGNTGTAWRISMLDGSANDVSKSFFSPYYLWPVRGGGSSNSVISLPRTGQITCYDASGSSMACTGTLQDGEFLMGAAWPEPRFVDNGNQTVTDNLTGLIWTKDGKAPGPAACGPGTPKTWQGALDYVQCLNTNHYLNRNDWHLPNRKELWSLFHAGQPNSAVWLTTQGFSDVQSGYYWSSNTYAAYAVGAWVADMGNGYVNGDDKSVNHHVWPVILDTTPPTTTADPPGGSYYGSTPIVTLSANEQATIYYTTNATDPTVLSSVYSTPLPMTATTTLKFFAKDLAGNSETVKTHVYNIAPLLKGDVNGNGAVDLTDALLAMQVLSRITPAPPFYKNADVSGDVRIGLQEAIYILQKMAEMR
jgi:hypothetical protein